MQQFAFKIMKNSSLCWVSIDCYRIFKDITVRCTVSNPYCVFFFSRAPTKNKNNVINIQVSIVDRRIIIHFQVRVFSNLNLCKVFTFSSIIFFKFDIFQNQFFLLIKILHKIRTPLEKSLIQISFLLDDYVQESLLGIISISNYIEAQSRFFSKLISYYLDILVYIYYQQNVFTSVYLIYMCDKIC